MRLREAASAGAGVRELPLILVLAGLVALFAQLAPGFFNPVNIAAIGRDSSVIGLLAIGLAVVVLGAGIDLSCASLMALSASIMALAMKATGDIPLPLAAGLLVALGLGAVNGLLVTRGSIPAMVTTLATLSLYRMQAMKMVTLVSPLPVGFSAIGSGWWPSLILIVATAASATIVARSAWGRHLIAIGGNADAARLAGVDGSRTLLLSYVFSGFTAGVAGVVASATLNSVQGNMFLGYELDAVAAVVIGGTSLAGGRGGVLGPAIAAVLMGVIRNGLIVAGMDVYWYQAIIGLAILVVAGSDLAFARRSPAGVRA